MAISLNERDRSRLHTPTHPLRGCGSDVMATQRQLLVLLMTTLMLGTGFAGCLGGDDGGGDTTTNPDNGGDGTEITPVSYTHLTLPTILLV